MMMMMTTMMTMMIYFCLMGIIYTRELGGGVSATDRYHRTIPEIKIIMLMMMMMMMMVIMMTMIFVVCLYLHVHHIMSWWLSLQWWYHKGRSRFTQKMRMVSLVGLTALDTVHCTDTWELGKFHFPFCVLCPETLYTLYTHLQCTHYTVYTLYTACTLWTVLYTLWHDLTASSALTNAFYKSRLGTTKQLIRSHWKYNPKF